MASTGETWMTARPFSAASSRPIPNFGCSLRSASAGPETGPSTAESPRSLTGRATLTSSPSSCRGRPTTSAARSGSSMPAPAPTRRGSRPTATPTMSASFHPGRHWSVRCPSTTWTISHRSAAPVPGTSPASPGSLCDSQPGQQLGCYNQGSEGSEFAGSRSRHPGGVNTLFGDGSVHFMKNTINALTWVQLGSINGGEVISSDQY